MTLSIGNVVMMASVLPLSLAVVRIGGAAYRRLRGYAVARCVARISEMVVAEVEPSDRDIRSLRYRYTVGVVLDSVLFVAEKIYGDALNRIVLIVEDCELDYYLLGLIRRKSGSQRVRNLSKLSLLTNATIAVERAEIYLDEPHRTSRFCAMAALVAARPNRAIHYIGSVDDELTLYEVAVLTQLMRRAGTAIAYTPLLVSQNRNLQLVGIYLCEHFSIIDAEPHLQRLVVSEDKDVAYLALQALCAIHGDISNSRVGAVLQRLTPCQRISFILRSVYNCYSLRSCAHHLTHEERIMFSQRVNSYKCRIVCN